MSPWSPSHLLRVRLCESQHVREAAPTLPQPRAKPSPRSDPHNPTGLPTPPRPTPPSSDGSSLSPKLRLLQEPHRNRIPQHAMLAAF